MDTYSPTSICPKCLHTDVKTRYSNGMWSGSNSCYYGCPEQGRGEHMERTCQRCGYRWAQSVATAPRGAGKQEG